MDEPFVDDAAYRVVSGVPVRYYPGGKEQGSCVDIPCPTEGDEGDVLTVVDGAPVWAPPSGGSGGYTGAYGLDPAYWLLPQCANFTVDTCPFTRDHANEGGNSGNIGKGAPLTFGTDISGVSELVLATGTGDITGFLLPKTTDGQTLVTPLSGKDLCIYYGNAGPDYQRGGDKGGYDQFMYVFIVYITDNGTEEEPVSGSVLPYLTDDGDTNTSTNTWFSCVTAYWNPLAGPYNLGSVEFKIPSAINTTSTAATDVGLHCNFSMGTRSWELRALMWYKDS